MKFSFFLRFFGKKRVKMKKNENVVKMKKMRKKKPDYLLVLIWSFRKEVIRQELNFLRNGGKLIFHLPRLHIVNIDNYKSYLTKDFKNLSYNY